ncbi:hypothetical protein CC85DRAFT_288671 [Cutaneotrichosporon oleaginosum]|uniref:Uncharacterized protein n=1 Tax=Cutaneotrichosporon oleaginosum TaxID=879819 RepID=A0A0J0XE17_9TREE|nr:uncharacterized protein CC85DRAFT_288671 [Cutaneotrichosporon oleaginosum]KLT39345.1 hypothetical protein CC85DRAFT_288671 [Cutaneotrichosporon oleaginosum]TXT08541.1 hypothetical protein COLE_05465 [Cutaneotrichosporon oleaginosum]
MSSPPPAPTPTSTTPGPGPSAAAFKRRPERAYTGPTEHGALGPRAGAGAAEAERYFAELPEAAQPIMPRTARALGIGSWVVGGVACAYMILYADYGAHEHVFSPIRRAFHAYTADMFTLSKSERGMLGLDEPPKAQALAAGAARAPLPSSAPAPAAAPEAPPAKGRSWWKIW